MTYSGLSHEGQTFNVQLKLQEGGGKETVIGRGGTTFLSPTENLLYTLEEMVSEIESGGYESTRMFEGYGRMGIVNATFTRGEIDCVKLLKGIEKRGLNLGTVVNILERAQKVPSWVIKELKARRDKETR
jgi:hypothetical protein